MKTDDPQWQQTEAGERIIWENFRHDALWAASMSYRDALTRYANVLACFGLYTTVINVLVLSKDIVDPEALHRVLTWINAVHPWNPQFTGSIPFDQNLFGDLSANLKILQVFDFLHLDGKLRPQRLFHAYIYNQLRSKSVTAQQMGMAWRVLRGDTATHHSELLEEMMKNVVEWVFTARLKSPRMDWTKLQELVD